MKTTHKNLNKRLNYYNQENYRLESVLKFLKNERLKNRKIDDINNQNSGSDYFENDQLKKYCQLLKTKKNNNLID